MTPDTELSTPQGPGMSGDAERENAPQDTETARTRRVEEAACRHEGCGAPSQFVGDTGWCWSHDPDLAAERRRASSLGGARTKQRYARGINPDELGSLDSPADAARWARIVAAGVASGRISASAGNSIRALLSEWRSAHEAAALEQEVARLRKQLGRAAR